MCWFPPPPARHPQPREGDEGTRLDGEQPPEQGLTGSSYDQDALSPLELPSLGAGPLGKEERVLPPASQGQVLAFATGEGGEGPSTRIPREVLTFATGEGGEGPSTSFPRQVLTFAELGLGEPQARMK